MNSKHDCVCVPCSYHVALESLLAGAKAEIARLTTKLQPAFDQPAPDGTLLCAICDQSEVRGHAPDCPGPNWPRLYISWLNDKRNTAESALTAERQKVKALRARLTHAAEAWSNVYSDRGHATATAFKNALGIMDALGLTGETPKD